MRSLKRTLNESQKKEEVRRVALVWTETEDEWRTHYLTSVAEREIKAARLRPADRAICVSCKQTRERAERKRTSTEASREENNE